MVRHVASWTFQNGAKQSPLNALDMMNAMAFDGVDLEPAKRQPLSRFPLFATGIPTTQLETVSMIDAIKIYNQPSDKVNIEIAECDLKRDSKSRRFSSDVSFTLDWLIKWRLPKRFRRSIKRHSMSNKLDKHLSL